MQQAENESILEYVDEDRRYRDIGGSYQERVLLNSKHGSHQVEDPPVVISSSNEGLVGHEEAVQSSLFKSSGYGTLNASKNGCEQASHKEQGVGKVSCSLVEITS